MSKWKATWKVVVHGENTPLQELVEAVNDPNYDPADTRSRAEQNAMAELEEALAAGAEVVDLPVENAPPGVDMQVQMILQRPGVTAIQLGPADQAPHPLPEEDPQ